MTTTTPGPKGLELNTIPESMQPDVVSSFWTMLQELASQADNNDDTLLKVQVEGWYRQWNRMTGDDKAPRWTSRVNVGQLLDPLAMVYTGSTKPDDIAAKIREIVVEHMGITLGDLDGVKSLAEIGADSLDEIELVMALEDEFAIEIFDEEAESMTSLERAVEIVLKKVVTAN